jgi:hypothetical protein
LWVSNLETQNGPFPLWNLHKNIVLRVVHPKLKIAGLKLISV